MPDVTFPVVPPEVESNRACHGEESYRNFWWNFSAPTPYTFWPKVREEGKKEKREVVVSCPVLHINSSKE